MDTEARRHFIDAKLQTAMELLEKAQAMVTIAWEDRAAAASLAYCDVMALTASSAANDASTSCGELYREIQEEKARAEGTQRNSS